MFSQISSATLIANAKSHMDEAASELAPFFGDATIYGDWTNLQAAENLLLEALVAVRVAKVGVLRRCPSFNLPEWDRANAHISVAVGEALNLTTKTNDSII